MRKSTTKDGRSASTLRAEDSVGGKLVFRRPHRSSIQRRLPPSQRADSSLSRLNTVCPYYTMFPVEFPLSRLANAKDREWILDPFCGRGTTLYAARLLGLPCVGIDSNPLAAALAGAKLATSSANAVVEIATEVLSGKRKPRHVPAGKFWRLCFHRSTLHDICVLRERLLRSCRTPAEVVLRALVLGILHGPKNRGLPTYLSNQMPRTYATKPEAAVRYWQNNKLTSPPAVDVLDAITRRAQHVLSRLPPGVGGAIYFGDARAVQALVPSYRRFSWVVTSPPYFGLRTYRPDQWLRNWFLGGPAVVDYAEKGQLPHHEGSFARELAAVWKATARRCLPGARLIVRFGHLPSIPLDARALLRESLELSDAGWRVYRWADAGSSGNGKRQATQFRGSASDPACEVDMYAKLEC